MGKPKQIGETVKHSATTSYRMVMLDLNKGGSHPNIQKVSMPDKPDKVRGAVVNKNRNGRPNMGILDEAGQWDFQKFAEVLPGWMAEPIVMRPRTKITWTR